MNTTKSQNNHIVDNQQHANNLSICQSNPKREQPNPNQQQHQQSINSLQSPQNNNPEPTPTNVITKPVNNPTDPETTTGNHHQPPTTPKHMSLSTEDQTSITNTINSIVIPPWSSATKESFKPIATKGYCEACDKYADHPRRAEMATKYAQSAIAQSIMTDPRNPANAS